MATISDVTLLVAPPPPKRETITLDMSHLRYAVLGIGGNRAVWAVFGLYRNAKDFIELHPAHNLRIIDLTSGSDVTAAL